MARYCSSCGHEIGEDTAFCKECGAPQPAAEQEQSQQAEPHEAAPQETAAPETEPRPPVHAEPPLQRYVPRLRAWTWAGMDWSDWLIIGACAICLISVFLPFADGAGIWLNTSLVIWYMPVALSAVAAISIVVYASRRVQLAACGFLLAAFFLAVRLLTFPDAELGRSPALWVAAVFAIIASAVALWNGLRTGGRGQA